MIEEQKIVHGNKTKIKDFDAEKLFENLRSLPHAPSVQMHDRAPDGITVKDVPKGTSEGNPDVR